MDGVGDSVIVTTGIGGGSLAETAGEAKLVATIETAVTRWVILRIAGWVQQSTARIADGIRVALAAIERTVVAASQTVRAVAAIHTTP